jgi:Right handed beta helix region
MPRILAVLLSLLCTIPVFALTRPLQVDVSEPETIDDANRIEWQVTLSNNDAAVNQVTFYVWPSFGPHTVVQAPEGCSVRYADQYECVVNLEPHSSRAFGFTTQTQKRIGAFWLSAEAFGNGHAVEHETTVFGYPYLVTTVDDSGPGSLRQAIGDINRDCHDLFDPCSVQFNIDGPVPPEGFFTIRLKSALPEIIAGDVSFDGRSQARHTGQTNPSGPEVLLDGSAVASGHGLAFRGAYLDVRDLAIGGFPENGIDYVTFGGQLTLRRAYLGVDATGMTRLGNGYRGVQATGGDMTVTDSVLSGNGRAGAWFWTTEQVTVERCKVGVGADGVTAIGNGAAGLFFHNPSPRYRMATARDNIIGNNQTGIAVSTMAVGNFAENVIRNNVNGAIDLGIDGPTLETKKGNPGQGGMQGPPAILSARYENGITTIVGVKNVPAGTTRVFDNIYVYANRSVDANGFAEAEELIGVLEGVRDNTFTLQVAADLRGRYITASQYTVFVYNWDDPAPGTSEVGLPRIVE